MVLVAMGAKGHKAVGSDYSVCAYMQIAPE